MTPQNFDTCTYLMGIKLGSKFEEKVKIFLSPLIIGYANQRVMRKSTKLDLRWLCENKFFLMHRFIMKSNGLNFQPKWLSKYLKSYGSNQQEYSIFFEASGNEWNKGWPMNGLDPGHRQLQINWYLNLRWKVIHFWIFF